MLSVTHYFALGHVSGPRQPSFLRRFQRYRRVSLNSQPIAFVRVGWGSFLLVTALGSKHKHGGRCGLLEPLRILETTRPMCQDLLTDPYSELPDFG
jgi:hypothetical protein